MDLRIVAVALAGVLACRRGDSAPPPAIGYRDHLNAGGVAPAGGTKPLFGTNPMSFAWPRPGGPPFCFDMATSASARGEIQIRMRDGRQLPEGWAIGPDGKPTTDPRQALLGAQLPFGGFKGSSSGSREQGKVARDFFTQIKTVYLDPP